MRLIDADKLYNELKEVSKLKGTTDKGRERARYIAEFIDFFGDASTIEAIPIEWLKENLIGTDFYFGKGFNNILAGETVWQMIVDWWKEDNGDEWWRKEQNDETD